MRIEVHQVSPFQTNCYVISTDGGDECVVVDPGITAWTVLPAVLERAGLTPVAVLLTHGHLDHSGDAHLLADQHRVPVYCGRGDHPMLATPSLGLGPTFAPLVEEVLGGDELPLPADLRAHPDTLEVAGLRIESFDAPGHTPGSTLLQVSDGEEQVVLTGDVVFAGSIGRTDLPGGNMGVMRSSLKRILDHYDDDVPLLPGHGPATTLGAERTGNQFLQPDFLR